MNRRVVLPVLLALSLAASGCTVLLIGTGAAVGAGAVVWYSGWLRANITEPLERVQRAAKSALSDLKVAIESETARKTSASFAGDMPDGRRIVVEVKALRQKETLVRIRVGIMGDHAASMRVYEQMKKHL